MGIFRLIKKFLMWSFTILLFLATFATGMFARAAHAQGYGCGWDQYGNRVCGWVEPTCEQQPRPGCWNYRSYGYEYQQQPQRVCWVKRNAWGQHYKHCKWQ